MAKRITAKQRAARKRNIKVARKALQFQATKKRVSKSTGSKLFKLKARMAGGRANLPR